MADYAYLNRDKEGKLQVTDLPAEGKNRLMTDPVSRAGAGRGGRGGPSAKELRDYGRKQNEGVYTADMGAPPQEPEGMKRGGKVNSASRRADGIAQRGKTKGTLV